MAEYSGPWASVPLPDNRYQRLFSGYGTGVVGSPLVPIAALNPGATAFLVQPFEAVCRGRYFELDAPVTVTPGAPSSQRRVDRLVLRFDPSAGSAGIVIVQGSPAATGAVTPTVPALTRTDEGVFELPLARVTVNPSAPTLSGLVLDTSYAAFPIVPCRTAGRPEAPVVGQAIYDLDAGQQLIWNGGGWRSPVPDPQAPVLVRGEGGIFSTVTTIVVGSFTLSRAASVAFTASAGVVIPTTAATQRVTPALLMDSAFLSVQRTFGVAASSGGVTAHSQVLATAVVSAGAHTLSMQFLPAVASDVQVTNIGILVVPS